MTSQSESRKTQRSLITLRQLCRSASLDWVTPDPALPGHSVTNSNQHSRGQPTAWPPAGADRRCTDGGHAARRVATQPGLRPPPAGPGRTPRPAVPCRARWGHQLAARLDERAGQDHRTRSSRGTGHGPRQARTAVPDRRDGPAAGPAGRTGRHADQGIRPPVTVAAGPSRQRPVDDRRRVQDRAEMAARTGTTAAELHRCRGWQIAGGARTLRTVMTGHAEPRSAGAPANPGGARPFGAPGRSPG